MPNKRAVAVLLGALLVSITAVSETPKQLKKEFQRLYDHKAKASAATNVDVLLSDTTPDYVVRLRNGQTMTRLQLESRLRKYFASGQLVKQLSFKYIVRNVVLQGGDAVVEVEQRDKRIQLRQDRKPHKIEANVIHRDTWTKTPEGWKMRLTEELEQTRFTVDGKPTEAK